MSPTAGELKSLLKHRVMPARAPDMKHSECSTDKVINEETSVWQWCLHSVSSIRRLEKY